ncbi:hypothetical protein V6C03_00620 [Methyloligella sp. 2.7D]|uniref:hypothetical protein n=1 Tax=unclassified Methyloligella TaxID=2625955 RepID=UPI00157C6484|nr:hypothetical protein [Methyloligella sp. GL2]QKP76825.1 hypothetical protein HT051_04795 [Methyloligella sp. GL2]
MSRQNQATAIYAEATSEKPVLSLSGLCNDAADHVARARTALDLEAADPDMAMAHLDNAIGCLKAMVAESKAILRGA